MLLQGDNVTKGLKKVTDDMKTKNRADRTGVVSTTAGLAFIELLEVAQTGQHSFTNLPQLGFKMFPPTHL